MIPVMIHSHAPDGYIVDDLLVWEELGPGGVVAQGFRLWTLDARSAADVVQESIRDKLAALYRGLNPELRLQHRYRPAAVDTRVIAAYEAVTARSSHPAVRIRRQAHAAR